MSENGRGQKIRPPTSDIRHPISDIRPPYINSLLQLHVQFRGIVSPCCAVVAFVNAPVATSNILFNFFSLNFLNKYPEKIVAQHAQP